MFENEGPKEKIYEYDETGKRVKPKDNRSLKVKIVTELAALAFLIIAAWWYLISSAP